MDSIIGYLDRAGFIYFWGKIKGLLDKKVDRDGNKKLSDENFTHELKDKLDGIAAGANGYTHPTYTNFIGVPIQDQEPDFGETFKVGRIATNTLGHVTSIEERTIKIPNTEMRGATSSRNGQAGLVPTPSSGSQEMFLRGDGSWGAVVTKDRYVNVRSKTNARAYILGTTSAPTSTAKETKAVADDKVYLDTGYGTLHADYFSGDGSGITNLNAENLKYNEISVDYLPYANSGANGNSSSGIITAADKAKLDDFLGAENYAVRQDITRIYRHRGNVQKKENLPGADREIGDVWNVIESGMNYAWNGSVWDSLGQEFSITSISNQQIDALQ